MAQSPPRLARAARTLSPGGLMLSAAMNGFYGWKRVTGNTPADAEPPRGTIAHPRADAPPVRLRMPRLDEAPSRPFDDAWRPSPRAGRIDTVDDPAEKADAGTTWPGPPATSART